MSRAMRIIEKIDVFFQSPPSPETFCITARKFKYLLILGFKRKRDFF